MANENKNLPMRDFSEKWENLTFANNFIFYKVLRHHPEACKHIIEMLLDIKIEKIEMSSEESFAIDYDSKGIRLDVFVKDCDQMFDVELQVANTKELPERARYYQGLMDIDTLKSGQKYKELKNSHVIFLCMKDIFEKNMPVYTFENLCLENNVVKLGDRAFKHFFIAPLCAKMIKDKEVRDFFNFLVSNKFDGKFTSDLSDFVSDAKHNSQWRVQYMTWERQRAYDYDDGKEAGILEGSKNTAIENAKNALNLGLTAEQAAQITSLSLEEVLSLKEEISV